MKRKIYIPANYSTGIKIKRLKEYAEKIKEWDEETGEGDTMLDSRGRRLKILKKYEHFVLTDHGCYQWIDVFMQNERRITTTSDGYIYCKRIKEIKNAKSH